MSASELRQAEWLDAGLWERLEHRDGLQATGGTPQLLVRTG